MYFTTFFGYLVDQVERFLEDYGFHVTRAELMLSITTDNAPEVVTRLFEEDRFSGDEKQNINVLVLREGEEPGVEAMQYMKPLQQWYQIVMAGDLINVIESHAVRVEFQPIVSMSDRSVFGYECLARGIARDGSIIPPADLFSQAKELQLLFNLDRVVRETVLKTAHSFGMTEHVFINFLPNAIYDPEYCLRTTMALAESIGIDHSRIVFEIVESESFDDIEHLKRILTFYQSRGVKTALDDVGSGYSSLNTLATLKPDIMKLDMHLIRGIDRDKLKQSIFSGLCKIADENGITLLAEGIETPDELAFVTAAGVPLLQGFYFSRPLETPSYELPADL